MLYYRVKRECGDKVVRASGHYLVPNELITRCELKTHHIPACAVSAVEVSKRNIYWFFGARFEVGTSCDSVLY